MGDSPGFTVKEPRSKNFGSKSNEPQNRTLTHRSHIDVLEQPGLLENVVRREGVNNEATSRRRQAVFVLAGYTPDYCCNKIETVPSLRLAVARSSFPSPSKSAAVI